jgi:histone-lysine N-methyltransferase SETMAR
MIKSSSAQTCVLSYEKANKDSAFTHISRTTGDNSWIYGDDPETKQQLSQWENPQSPRAKKSRHVRSSTKSTLIFFFNMKMTVHCEFVPRNTMVNSDCYCDVLRHLRENVGRKRPEVWCNHKNVPAPMSLKTTEFVTNNNMVIVPHPPYSLDLAPSDFTLFPKLKMKLKGRYFETVSDNLTSKGNHKQYSTALRK